ACLFSHGRCNTCGSRALGCADAHLLAACSRRDGQSILVQDAGPLLPPRHQDALDAVEALFAAKLGEFCPHLLVKTLALCQIGEGAWPGIGIAADMVLNAHAASDFAEAPRSRPIRSSMYSRMAVLLSWKCLAPMARLDCD